MEWSFPALTMDWSFPECRSVRASSGLFPGSTEPGLSLVSVPSGSFLELSAPGLSLQYQASEPLSLESGPPFLAARYPGSAWIQESWLAGLGSSRLDRSWFLHRFPRFRFEIQLQRQIRFQLQFEGRRPLLGVGAKANSGHSTVLRAHYCTGLPPWLHSSR